MRRKNYAPNLNDSFSSLQMPTAHEVRKYQQIIQSLT